MHYSRSSHKLNPTFLPPCRSCRFRSSPALPLRFPLVDAFARECTALRGACTRWCNVSSRIYKSAVDSEMGYKRGELFSRYMTLSLFLSASDLRFRERFSILPATLLFLPYIYLPRIYMYYIYGVRDGAGRTERKRGKERDETVRANALPVTRSST